MVKINGMETEKKRILVVDDEPSITRLLKLNLEQTNEYVVRAENDSEAAVAAAEEFQPDLILQAGGAIGGGGVSQATLGRGDQAVNREL